MLEIIHEWKCDECGVVFRRTYQEGWAIPTGRYPDKWTSVTWNGVAYYFCPNHKLSWQVDQQEVAT